MKRHVYTIVVTLLSACFAIPLAYAESASYPGSNPLEAVSKLSGRYVAMRHGESVPSSEKRVCSSMEAGKDPINGLTDKGREESETSARKWIKANKQTLSRYLKANKLVIVTSPFSRTRETAEILADTLQDALKGSLPSKYRADGALRGIIRVEDDLRERYFGKYEGHFNSGKVYDKVWAKDAADPNQTKGKVESAAAVQARTTAVIAALDEEAKKSGGKLFILTSHGDTLKILQTGFQKASPSDHMNAAKVPPFKTAEIRELKLAPAAH